MKIKKIAVTGGLSSGKSTVCQFFKELGAYVVNADEITHRLLSPDTKVAQQVIELFGPDIVSHGKIDRSKIAKKAFNNPILLQALENLLHPIILDEIEKEYQSVYSNYPLFVAEIPLLFEIGADIDYSTTILVTADEQKCKERYETSKNVKQNDDFYQRKKRQMSAEEKAARATYIIENNCSLESLKMAVSKLYKLLIST